MNATVARMDSELTRMEPEVTGFSGSSRCAEEITQINESLHRREDLLAASAKASRLLLEAPDVRAVIPQVLGLIGESARVDRVNLMLTKAGPNGERLLAVQNEWVAEGVVPYLTDPGQCTCDERDFSSLCSELRAGRSVCLSMSDSAAEYGAGFEGIGTKTKAVVPIFIGGEFTGLVSFDNTKQRRAIDTAELAALETAAGVIGAALHRERLVDDVRRERERAAEERVAELAKANQVIRGNLERLASEPDLGSFMGHVLLEAARQFDAAGGAVIVSKDSLQEWRIIAHVRDGQVRPPPFATSVPFSGSPFTEVFAAQHEPVYFDLTRGNHSDIWPGALEAHKDEGYVGVVVYPLVFGGRNVGFFILSFRRNAEDVTNSELLVALAQQATLAVQLTRLAYSAKEAAVLVERTRIGQEIHDGLAQSFTGILMQLGAAEEFPSCKRKNSELSTILSRIRDLARDGLSEARRSVMALRLDQTRRAGLEIALRQLAERSTVPGGVTCTFEGSGITTGLKPEHEHELLRISQEAVSNAVRHARPSKVSITMTDGPSHWELAVTDDGVGMEHHPEHYANEGFGLSSMQQRAGAIGGEWHIESRPGAGTRVSVRMAKRGP
ncbi:MAG TPA: GAF domain-containing sensor histidine kinase [Steroidobacteraceae bacterium]|nr:GAF domain-containing sensor histidine kinase [Steroidobacteraceae bacterium]